MSLLLLFQNSEMGSGGAISYNSSMNLFIHGMDTHTEALDLFMQGPSSDISEKSLNLYIGGSNYYTAGSMSLLLYNEMIANSATLYIRGSGVTAGGFPYNNSLNLYINRMPSEAMPLYLRGPGDTIIDDITFFISGAYPVNSSMNLVMPDSTGLPTAEVNLYTHGF